MEQDGAPALRATRCRSSPYSAGASGGRAKMSAAPGYCPECLRQERERGDRIRLHRTGPCGRHRPVPARGSGRRGSAAATGRWRERRRSPRGAPLHRAARPSRPGIPRGRGRYGPGRLPGDAGNSREIPGNSSVQVSRPGPETAITVALTPKSTPSRTPPSSRFCSAGHSSHPTIWIS